MPRKEVKLPPQEPITSDMVQISQEVTEVLDYEPGRLVVIRYIRPIYLKPTSELTNKQVIAPAPERPIAKCLAGAGLLTQILIDKFLDHLPLYRQLQRFERVGIQIGSSTINGWVQKTAKLLKPLYQAAQKLVFSRNYLQIDESPIKVLDKNKEKGIHTGYLWFYRAEDGVFIQYHPSRGSDPPDQMLKNYQGHIQTDGYGVYEHLEKQDGIELFGCWAHVRRKFYEIRNVYKQSEVALRFIDKLYRIEREIKEKALCPEQAAKLRRYKAAFPLAALKTWMQKTKAPLKSKMKLHQAIVYTQKRWQKLTKYLWYGKVQIDNNLVENAIRPIAIGRKNYLFMGNHQAAENAAIVYTLLANAKMHNVNPTQWLTDVIKKINEWPQKQIHALLPMYWKSDVNNMQDL